MDKTKKYTLIFVVICFLLIGGAGVYQMYIPASSDNETSVVDQKQIQEEPKEEDSQKSSESKETDSNHSTTNTQKKETTSSSKKTNQTTQQEPQKKTESSSSTQPEVEPETKIQVGLVIQGIDSAIVNEQVKIEKGQTVYSVLKKVTSEKGIELKTSGPTAIIYIKGINGLNEFDNGPASGWKYKVNGNFPNQSAGAYKVENGDQIEWIYTTNG